MVIMVMTAAGAAGTMAGMATGTMAASAVAEAVATAEVGMAAEAAGTAADDPAAWRLSGTPKSQPDAAAAEGILAMTRQAPMSMVLSTAAARRQSCVG